MSLFGSYFNAIEEFVKKENRLPSVTSQNINERRLANWIKTQQKNSNQGNFHETIKWKTFKKQNANLFSSEQKNQEVTEQIKIPKKQPWIEKWKNNFKKLKTFIRTEERLPRSDSLDTTEVELYNWTQSYNKVHIKNLQKNLSNWIVDAWENLIEKCVGPFLTRENFLNNIWIVQNNSEEEQYDLEEKQYDSEEEQYDSENDSENDEDDQDEYDRNNVKFKTVYENKESEIAEKYENETLKDESTESLKNNENDQLNPETKEIDQSNIALEQMTPEFFEEKLNSLIHYIRKKRILPKWGSKSIEVKQLIMLITTRELQCSQQINESSLQSTQRWLQLTQRWQQFRQECSNIFLIYNDGFIKNEKWHEAWNQVWDENLKKLETFVEEKKRIPLDTSNNIYEIDLFVWLKEQNKLYTKQRKQHIVNDQVKKWEKFVNDHVEILPMDWKIWRACFAFTQNLIETENRLPERNAGPYESYVAKWFKKQFRFYRLRKGLMEHEEYRTLWANFLITYHDFFLNDLYDLGII